MPKRRETGGLTGGTALGCPRFVKLSVTSKTLTLFLGIVIAVFIVLSIWVKFPRDDRRSGEETSSPANSKKAVKQQWAGATVGDYFR